MSTSQMQVGTKEMALKSRSRSVARRVWTLSHTHGMLWCYLIASLLPFAFAQEAPTTAPTLAETVPATVSPSPTASPNPSQQPTPMPTNAPTATSLPSFVPTVTPQPTATPTGAPTITPMPTVTPTGSPMPSATPSQAPTGEPTFAMEITSRAVFNQRFQIGTQNEFNGTEKRLFCGNMASYTAIFGRADDRVKTNCTVISQVLQVIGAQRGRGLIEYLVYGERRLQVVFNQVEYSMSYRSFHENVTGYATEFQNYINEDLPGLTADLQNATLSVESSFLAFNNIETISPTSIPTITPNPTTSPTMFLPSPAPSDEFSRPPAIPGVTSAPTIEGPTAAPLPDTVADGNNTTTIVVSTIAVVTALMIGLFLFYRRRQRRLERKFQADAATKRTTAQGPDGNGKRNRVAGGNDMRVDTGTPYQQATIDGNQEVSGMISPADSLLSKESLISLGPSPLTESSPREEDRTARLADEFDQYKDQNLETMRTGVEENLTGFDGMMSQALTKALMDDDSELVDMPDLRWGGTGDSTEIEATVLCEVTDWLKRKEGATMEEK